MGADNLLMSEAELIQGLLASHETAFRHAVKLFQRPMRQLASSICGDSIADEVVQEAWLSAISALPKFEARSSLKTWLLRITANEAKSRLRRENRLTSLDALVAEDEGFINRFDEHGHWSTFPSDWHTGGPAELLSRDQLKSCLELMIQSLPDMQSATIQLKEQQNFSLKEICNILEVSESNVRVLLHRARQQVYQCIEHFQNTGECCTRLER